MPPTLTLSFIRYWLRVKWGNPGKGVAPFPKFRCKSYQKGSLWLPLDYGRLILLLYTTYFDWINLLWMRKVSRYILYDIFRLVKNQFIWSHCQKVWSILHTYFVTDRSCISITVINALNNDGVFIALTLYKLLIQFLRKCVDFFVFDLWQFT